MERELQGRRLMDFYSSYFDETGTEETVSGEMLAMFEADVVATRFVKPKIRESIKPPLESLPVKPPEPDEPPDEPPYDPFKDWSKDDYEKAREAAGLPEDSSHSDIENALDDELVNKHDRDSNLDLPDETEQNRRDAAEQKTKDREDAKAERDKKAEEDSASFKNDNRDGEDDESTKPITCKCGMNEVDAPGDDCESCKYAEGFYDDDDDDDNAYSQYLIDLAEYTALLWVYVEYLDGLELYNIYINTTLPDYLSAEPAEPPTETYPEPPTETYPEPPTETYPEPPTETYPEPPTETYPEPEEEGLEPKQEDYLDECGGEDYDAWFTAWSYWNTIKTTHDAWLLVKATHDAWLAVKATHDAWLATKATHVAWLLVKTTHDTWLAVKAAHDAWTIAHDAWVADVPEVVSEPTVVDEPIAPDVVEKP